MNDNAGRHPARGDLAVPAPGVTPPTALTVAGSDSGGAAGLQADLRTFFACGVHGLAAVTSVTVQDSLGVRSRSDIPAETVAAQIDVVAADMGVDAAKTGMLASAEIIRAVAHMCRRLGIGRTGAIPLVVDPVAASRRGVALFDEVALDALRSELLPLATIATPNLAEVRLLTGVEVRSRDALTEAAAAVQALGPGSVLVTGGHLTDGLDSVDLLYDGTEFVEFAGPRVPTVHTHGSGDTLAAAITAALAYGAAVPDAVLFGEHVVRDAVRGSYPLGGHVGPVSLFSRLREVPDRTGDELVERTADGLRRVRIRGQSWPVR